jgi:hypothetical protein
LEEFRLQSRDLYVPAGDIGMWQGALRNPDDQFRADIVDAIEAGQSILIELLYSDLVGRQRTISRFSLFPTGDSWLASLNRHWYLEWDGPRPEDQTRAAVEVILRDQDAAVHSRASTEDIAEDDAGASVASESAGSDPQPVHPTNP